MTRLFMRIMICVILGAVTTVAVAWGFAVRAQLVAPICVAESDCVSYGSLHRRVRVAEFTGAVSLNINWHQARFDRSMSPNGLARLSSHPPGWAQPWLLPAASVDGRNDFVLGAGWPLTSLIAVRRRSPAHADAITTWAVELPEVERPVQTLPGVGARISPLLPLRPIIQGFALNTAFYAGIVGVTWILTSRAAASIRWRRRNHNRCVACSYDLRGNKTGQCSECGTVTNRVTEAAAAR